MAGLLVILCGLVCSLAASRAESAGKIATDAVVWGTPRGTKIAWALAVLGALAAQAPVIWGFRVFFAPHALLLGDAPSHATIAQEVARAGLPHGWIDSFNGGFPFGVHYQSLGYLLIALLIRLGLSTIVATQLVGLGATIALPVVVVFAARAAGARPTVGLLAATIVAWAAPSNTFVGGWETYIVGGLISQALALPLAVALAITIACDTPRYRAPVLAALLAATHPQVTTCFFAALLPAFLVSGGQWRGRAIRAAVVAAIVCVAIYGRGVTSLGVPFGFPAAMPVWKQLGFSIDHIPDWIWEGTLFDVDRPPAISMFWIAAWTVLLAKASQRLPRALLASSVVALVLSASGFGIVKLGGFGKVLLGFVMPLRITALVLVLIAACVVVALEELLRVVRWRWVAPAVPLIGLLAMSFYAAPSRWQWMNAHVAMLDGLRAGGGEECGPITPRGYRSLDAIAWVQDLDRGRFTFDSNGAIRYCNGVHDVELASSVPLGMCIGAATHLGTNVAAFTAAKSGTDGAWDRFETLGIRTVLHTPEETPPANEPWKQTHRSEALVMSERVGGTDLIGPACIDEVWTGDDDALRKALNDDLMGPATLLRHPRSLVELKHSHGPLERASIRDPNCDASDVSVVERRREPGALEADVTSKAAFDAVFRATAFSSWQTTIDGRVVPWRTVAPGFFAIGVPSGVHHLEAVASFPRGYLLGLWLALLLVIFVAVGGEVNIARFVRKIRRA